MLNKAVELHAEAAAEYDAAFDWYRKRSPDAARKSTLKLITLCLKF